MPKEPVTRLRVHIQSSGAKSDLLFVNRHGRPFSANKLREKQLHPFLDVSKIPRGGLSFAKTPADCEINSMAPAVSSPFCYNSSPCFASSKFCFGTLVRHFRGRQNLVLENLALRRPIAVLKRRHPRPSDSRAAGAEDRACGGDFPIRFAF